MQRSKRNSWFIYLGCSVFCVLIGALLYYWLSREPVYRSKPASYWVDQFAKAPLHNGNVNADLAILQFGPDVIPILISTLKKKEEPLTDLYAKVWPKIPIVIRKWFTPPAQKPSPAQYRASAAKMLGRLGKFGSPATRGLKKALKDKVAEVRLNAAYALWRIDPRNGTTVLPVLMQLHESATDLRYYTSRYLGLIGPDAKVALPLLVKSLGDADSDVRANAAKSIGQMGAEARIAVPALVERLKDPVVSVRVNAAEALGNLGNEANAAIPELIQAQIDESLRVVAAKAVEKIKARQPASR